MAPIAFNKREILRQRVRALQRWLRTGERSGVYKEDLEWSRQWCADNKLRNGNRKIDLDCDDDSCNEDLEPEPPLETLLIERCPTLPHRINSPGLPSVTQVDVHKVNKDEEDPIKQPLDNPEHDSPESSVTSRDRTAQ